MLKKDLKKLTIILVAILALALVGCASDTEEPGADPEQGGEGASAAEQLDYTITGIDAGAGVVQGAERAVEDYGLDFTVQTSSGAAMTQALGDAIENNEAIAVTGWSPHWKFAAYDLKYLEDPLGSFGEAEDIHTIARDGLAEDMPEAYEILGNFFWEHDHMEEVMMAIFEGAEPIDAAREWVDNNQDLVDGWIEGVDTVDGESIDLAYVAWDTEIASTHVIGEVLKDMGYDVSLTQVENGPMWNSVASGDTDAIVAAWLPVTHGDYWADFEDDVDDLGPNLEDAKIGLVVPAYLEADSIEDLVD